MGDNNIPRYAIVPNRGKGRVLSYHGKGYFEVLLPRDIRVHAHRSNLIFLPAKKKKAS